MKKWLTLFLTLPCLLAAGCGGTPEPKEVKYDLIPMVMVDGVLYYDSGYNSTVEGRCGVMDGEITSTVEGWETPTENDQSNFGAGYGYQIGFEEGTIEVSMNGEFRVFEKGSGLGKIRFHDKWFDKGYLSQETLEWLEWYNGLTEEEQLSISAIPSELLPDHEEAETEEAANVLGVTLSAKDVTPTGMTLVCTQSGGAPTGDELLTGQPYSIDVKTESGWADLPAQVEEIVFTMEGWMIPMESSVEWEVSWGYLYGELSPGTYRISKTIMDFRAAGDYDEYTYYAEFVIQ